MESEEKMQKKTADEKDAEVNSEAVLFQALIGKMICRKLKEDYWENEEIGWK